MKCRSLGQLKLKRENRFKFQRFGYLEFEKRLRVSKISETCTIVTRDRRAFLNVKNLHVGIQNRQLVLKTERRQAFEMSKFWINILKPFKMLEIETEKKRRDISLSLDLNSLNLREEENTGFSDGRVLNS